MRIVCVDDDPIFLSILTEFLRAEGRTEVTTYGDPVKVADLAVLGRIEADVFLLDLEMPGMTGAELCAALRATGAHGATPIIMVSSVKERGRVKEALAAGANDFLNKPLETVELGARLSMVERVLKERRRSERLESEMRAIQAQPEFSFRFEDAVLPNAEDGVVDYLALENHLMSLGWSGLPGTVVLCFRLRNALWAYANLERVDYFDFLSEAASVILEECPGAHYRLAYAGSGDFVAVLDRGQRPDPVELQMALQAAQGQMWEAYRLLGIPAPDLVVGVPVHAPFVGGNPRRLIQQARERVATTDTGLPEAEIRAARQAAGRKVAFGG
ncbi:response regulator [Rhodobacter sp. HX-7-19]|uniref:Response regulator n=1 Tax=Paragemmobacter kunshanensis TaxID=2583234 RepID=A0A6M1TJ54_9RHOB|nr:response regulator [Rhodobacter kunshanensis]NGQ89919.1 response regulator [Rhodobacter kunshanensis]